MSEDQPQKTPLPGRLLRRSTEVGAGIASPAATMGLHLVSCPAVGAAIGYGLDHLFGTGFLIFVMFFVGIIAGFRCIWQDAKKMQRLEDAKRGGSAPGTPPETPPAPSRDTGTE